MNSYEEEEEAKKVRNASIDAIIKDNLELFDFSDIVKITAKENFSTFEELTNKIETQINEVEKKPLGFDESDFKILGAVYGNPLLYAIKAFHDQFTAKVLEAGKDKSAEENFDNLSKLTGIKYNNFCHSPVFTESCKKLAVELGAIKPDYVLKPSFSYNKIDVLQGKVDKHLKQVREAIIKDNLELFDFSDIDKITAIENFSTFEELVNKIKTQINEVEKQLGFNESDCSISGISSNNIASYAITAFHDQFTAKVLEAGKDKSAEENFDNLSKLIRIKYNNFCQSPVFMESFKKLAVELGAIEPDYVLNPSKIDVLQDKVNEHLKQVREAKPLNQEQARKVREVKPLNQQQKVKHEESSHTLDQQKSKVK